MQYCENDALNRVLRPGQRSGTEFASLLIANDEWVSKLREVGERNTGRCVCLLKHAVHLNGLRCLQCWPGRPIVAVALVVVDTEVTRLSAAVAGTWNGARDGARPH